MPTMEMLPVLPAVFISYNPNSEFEQTLAIRLHTIGGIHGLNMLMPDRTYNSHNLSLETKARIMVSDFFIHFSAGPISQLVQQEINIASSKYQDRSKILVVREESLNKRIKRTKNCTEVFINSWKNPSEIIDKISNAIGLIRRRHGGDSFIASLGAMLLISTGFFVLNEVINENPKPRPRKSRKMGVRRSKKIE